jgi:hypothetical protein
MISPSDIEVAVLALWTGNSLIASVPGDLKTGRLVPPATQPYAQLRVKPKAHHFYTEGTGPYWTEFRVEIDLIGIGEKTTGDLVKAVGTIFDGALWSIPGANWLHTYLADDSPQLEQDPSIKQGEDYWKGTLAWDVAASAAL